ncbi:MAG: ThiF family adenylyltransferase [Candidatus Staskawiczbacteria bacterium]|nr:ThiF family adenylyltransferase [Candidatus Staskawiczbacteria bacterium]
MEKNNLNQPIILKEGEYTEKEIINLKDKYQPKIVDIYLQQLKEFFEIKNPQLVAKGEFSKEFLKFEKEKTQKDQELSGDWIYYSWSNILLHALGEVENDLLRTNRNKNIITVQEQEKLANFTIAIAGLSVGGNIATTLAYNGFSKNIKLADFDRLETSNLNRVKGKLSDVGELKFNIISRQLYEVDPYIRIVNFEKGLNKENVEDFFIKNPKTNLIFEIIDDLELKILIRKEAKKYRIPVVMLTSIGDTILIDLERYDQDSETKIFSGIVEEKVIEDLLKGKIPKEEVNKYVVQIVGIENIPPRVMDSMKQIGKTLVGRPQLMSTVTIASGIASFIARKIALGDVVLSGRTRVVFDDFIRTEK